MPPPVNTKSAYAVSALVHAKFRSMYPNEPYALIPIVFRDVEDMFAGHYEDYAAIDLRYHDLEHTLQAAVCMALLLEGRHYAGVAPVLTPRQYELAICAVLLHDSGYLRLRTDRIGTGAKYTYCHILRSCAFAASYLPGLGVDDYEIETIVAAINCTGPTQQLARLQFREPVERVIGAALATADFLGQMAAPDYPDELEALFNEFRESDDYLNVPVVRRLFTSPQDLIEKTPAFWEKFVLPRLANEHEGLFRYLARPYPDGPNPYLEAVEANIALIREKWGLTAPEPKAVLAE